MRASRKPNLDHRLEAYFATLRSSSLKEALKRSAGNWQIYAAVTGSAMAMVTGASAALIGSGVRDVTAQRNANARLSRQHLASSKNIPMVRAVKLAMAKQDSLLAAVKCRRREPGASPCDFTRRHRASRQHRRHDSAGRMGVDLRDQPRQRKRRLERRLPHYAGRHQRVDQR